MTTNDAPPASISEFLNARLDQEAEAWSNGIQLMTHPNFATLSRYMLRDIAAKRAIVELWEYRWQEANDATDQDMNAMYASQATGLGNAVRFLAKVYSDHPDYDPDWSL